MAAGTKPKDREWSPSLLFLYLIRLSGNGRVGLRGYQDVRGEEGKGLKGLSL